MTDCNQVLDEGAPTSTGGLVNAARLSDMMGLEPMIDPPRERYLQGWGEQRADARPIVYTWNMVEMDTRNQSTAIAFDLVEGESPLIVGMDVKRYADTYNKTRPPTIVIKRPSDTAERVFHKYISKDYNGNDFVHVEIEPHRRMSTNSLLSSSVKGTEGSWAKKLQRYTHAPK